MDLLRAAVAGAAGTPYHDQLFFFDIQLPPDYPGAPPLVQYHSWGMRANPNLVRPLGRRRGLLPLLRPGILKIP
jgi:ubiquitin-protein ligase